MAINAKFQCTAISIDAAQGTSSVSNEDVVDEIFCVAKFNPVCNFNESEDPEETPIDEREVLFHRAIEIPFIQLNVPDQEIFEVGMDYTFTIKKSRKQDSFIANCKKLRIDD